MRIHRAYKTELKLNNKQKTLLARCAGTARYAYNWGLRIRIDEYQATGKSPNYYELHRRLNALKKTELSWMYEVSKTIPQEALRDLDRAFQNFFRRLKSNGRQAGEKPGFPRFKSRHRGLGSFRIWEAEGIISLLVAEAAVSSGWSLAIPFKSMGRYRLMAPTPQRMEIMEVAGGLVAASGLRQPQLQEQAQFVPMAEMESQELAVMVLVVVVPAVGLPFMQPNHIPLQEQSGPSVA
jgi:putative transposase